MTEPTLTLQIPFILLGRRDTHILDPSLLPPHEQATKPITLLLQALQHFCPTIAIHPWALDTFDWQVAPPAKTTRKAKRAHAAAQAAAHDLAQHDAEEKWRALTSVGSEVWILRPAPSDSTFLSHVALQDWREGDGRLTAVEAAGLGRNVWSCPVLLQRFGVPVDTSSPAWARFVREACKVFGVLCSAFVNFQGVVDGPFRRVREARYWDLVVGRKCFLKFVVGQVDGETGHKMLILAAAFERELDTLRTTEEVVEFVGVGRWLEWMLLRKMARAQRATRRMRGEEQWQKDISVEDERYQRTKGRLREWWDVIHDMDKTEIIQGMRKFQGNGKIRLGTALHESSDHTYQFIFQGRHSTLNANQLIAYTALLARIVDTAQTLNLNALTEQLEDFQVKQLPDPTDRFSKMLSFLGHDVSDPSNSALTACLNPIDCTTHSSSTRFTSPAPRLRHPLESVDPFYDVRTYLEKKHEAGRVGMAGFIERYSRAVGYRPTKDEKLLAMLSAEKGGWKGRDRGQKKGGLKSVTADAHLGLESGNPVDGKTVQEEHVQSKARAHITEWLKYLPKR
ncbi:hypothetical protein EKO04_000619 [Ascochyta lentis]|uniref:Uncharacterized protein n=1 Tax=Ascochyta lentis TaxID=205686 RepID=A0A8H7JCZ2_9PLEO|nr:hypothetical protein EKO04_000619 [Ascochyta lentis]